MKEELQLVYRKGGHCEIGGRNLPLAILVERTCAICGRLFKADRDNPEDRYCSDICSATRRLHFHKTDRERLEELWAS